MNNSYFIFFKQKTAYELRISDWSSDVCSSDPGAGGDFMQRCETVADPGIIAQNVDAAVTGKGRSEHRIDLLDIGNIHATGLCQPANVSGNLLFGTADVCDGYRGALAREQFGHRFADT